MSSSKQHAIDYIAELSKSLKVLSLDIESIERDLHKVKNTLQTLSQLKDNINDFDAIIKANISDEVVKEPENVVKGEFDGYFMVWEDLKKYPVPVNYASKSKLIPGDKLKVHIHENGKLIYKLIEPAPRQHVRAVLSKDTTQPGKFFAITPDKQTFALNAAAVSFYKGLPGDEAYITINKNGVGDYAALETIITSN